MLTSNESPGKRNKMQKYTVKGGSCDCFLFSHFQICHFRNLKEVFFLKLNHDMKSVRKEVRLLDSDRSVEAAFGPSCWTQAQTSCRAFPHAGRVHTAQHKLHFQIDLETWCTVCCKITIIDKHPQSRSKKVFWYLSSCGLIWRLNLIRRSQTSTIGEKNKWGGLAMCEWKGPQESDWIVD